MEVSKLKKILQSPHIVIRLGKIICVFGMILFFTNGCASIGFEGYGREPDDCSLKFLGRSRAALKLRTLADTLRYEKHHSGKPIDVDAWFQWTPTLDTLVPADKNAIPGNAPIQGAETNQIILDGFLLAVRYEHAAGLFEKDNDFHMELSQTPEWNSDHVIVEIPAGQDYCDARKKAWSIVKADTSKAHSKIKHYAYILKKPVKIRVSGFVFLDAHHIQIGTGALSIQNGGRGFRHNGPSRVRGLWEIHPVTSLVLIE